MEISISRVGNSDGIILPKALMKRFSLKRSDVLVVDEDAPDLLLRKKTVVRTYEGPNKGFFAPLAREDGENDAWGGEMSSAEYLAELRKNEPETELMEPWI